ncbi:MAG: ATP-binding protein [Ferrimicrobium sp.]
MSLKVKLSILLGCLTSLLFLAGSIFLVRQVSQGLIGSATTVLKARALILAGNAPDMGTRSESGGGKTISIQVGNNTQVSSQVNITGTPFTLSTTKSTITLLQFVTPDASVVGHFGPTRSVLSVAQIKTSLKRPVTFVGTLRGAARNQLVLAEPLQGSAKLVIVLATPLSPITAETSRTTWFLVTVGIAVSALSAIAGYILSRAALKPVERMREAAAAMTESESFSSLEVPASNDEVAHLGRTLNDLLNKISRSNSRQRGFVAIAGHELRTPLTILKIELELAGRLGRTMSEMRTAIGAATQETDRLIKMTEQLLTLAKGDETQLAQSPVPFSVRNALSSVIAGFAAFSSESKVNLEIVDGTDPQCYCDPSGLHQVISNILENAIRFSPEGSTISASIRQVGEQVEIKISDQGPGFDPEIQEVAFERFVRGSNLPNNSPSGSGLGLSIVKSLAIANGGEVSLGNNPTIGAWVKVLVPLAPN